ncbi:MAG: SsrA-binding protein [Sphingobacteriales bacterium]|jgi:SsrA-binding protein
MSDQPNLNIKNKKAYFNYEISNTFEAGIQLLGSEIKSIRLGKVVIGEAFCQIKQNEMFLVNMYISEYEYGSTFFNHETTRVRKLLLHKREIKKLAAQIAKEGVSVVPIKMYITKKGIAKIMLGVGKGKKDHDKRDSIKQKDVKRETDRALKKYK